MKVVIVMFAFYAYSEMSSYMVFMRVCNCLYCIIPHVKGRTEAVHIYVPILSELLCKFCSQSRVQSRGKVSQSIPQSQLERQSEVKITESENKERLTRLDIEWS